ncbi:MAG: hypothetical protein JO225_13135 [Candidatus Eremiobacteraeota bacterium]|nr:hypothetical protein [Candidatus Eremiobacteraeota bacterium]
MQLRSVRSRLFYAALVLALAGCGGGGAASKPLTVGPTPPAGAAPPPGTVNPLTTYSASIGNDVFGQTDLDLTAFGTLSTLSGADLAPGAVVVYPDGSTQFVDAQGNFDASQSAYATANRAAFIADTGRAPQVVVYANDGLTTLNGTVLLTAGTSNPAVGRIVPYAAGAGSVTASRGRHVLAASGSTPNPVAITVSPASASVFSGGAVTFSALVRDVSGDLLGGNAAGAITWSLAKPAGCGFSPAGTIVPNLNDPSKARYIAPSTGGDFTAACPDLVVATANANGANVASSGAVSYFDKATAAQIAGSLSVNNLTPAAGAVVLFEAGGTEAYRGTFAARSSVSGGFRSRVPFFRTLQPLALVPSGATYALDGVAPSSLVPSAGGNSLISQSWQAGGVPAAPPPPIPDVVTPASDVVLEANLAREAFPFGAAPTAPGPTYAPGTIESVIHAGTPSTSGTLTAGAFTGYRYAVDATGTVTTLVLNFGSFNALNPNAISSVLLQITRTSATTFSFVRYFNGQGAFDVNNPSTLGARLDANGTWTETLSASTFTAALTMNSYFPGQALGSPYAVHTIAAQQGIGATAMTFTDQWTSASGTFLGTLSAARSYVAGPIASGPIFTYSATLARAYNTSGAGQVAVTYAIGGPAGASSATENVDTTANLSARFGEYLATITSSPSTVEQGLALDVTVNTVAAATSRHGMLTVTIDATNEPTTASTWASGGTASGHLAVFAVDAFRATTGAYNQTVGAQTFTLKL